MTRNDLKAIFEKHRDEYIEFDLVQNPLHPRPDLCAFLLLDRLCPKPGRDMGVAAGPLPRMSRGPSRVASPMGSSPRT